MYSADEENEGNKYNNFCLEVFENHTIFRDPIKIFQEKNIGNLNYFHLKIKIF